jgi:hypothetical protein
VPLAEHIRLESLEGKFLRLSYCLPWGSAYRDSALVLNLLKQHLGHNMFTGENVIAVIQSGGVASSPRES